MFKRLWRIVRSPVWGIARTAVQSVIHNYWVQLGTKAEERTVFCPRCGQIPDGDRRFDEARALAYTELEKRGLSARRHELDFALSFHYWRSKHRAY